jgi:hypothetical protein
VQLVGPASAANLTNYLSFSYDGTHTTIHVDHDGFGVGGSGFQPTLDIVLENNNLGNLGTDQQIIQSLLDGNNLVV